MKKITTENIKNPNKITNFDQLEAGEFYFCEDKGTKEVRSYLFCVIDHGILCLVNLQTGYFVSSEVFSYNDLEKVNRKVIKIET